jgi:hypothetical protein
MSPLPFIIWALTVVAGLVIYLIIAYIIEKSGLARLGATGHLFTCNPDAPSSKTKTNSDAEEKAR